jgi:hypothetical protein
MMIWFYEGPFLYSYRILRKLSEGMFQPLQTFSQLLPWTGNIDTDKIVSVFPVHTAFIDPDLFFFQ